MAPRWLTTLLERVVDPERVDDVVGDLQELHQRRRTRRGAALALLWTTLEGVGLAVVHGTSRLARGLAQAGGLSRVELRLALRLLGKQPVMTLTSVVALGVGIGLVAGGYSVFRQGLYGELPFPDPERWVNIESYAAESGRRAATDLERLQAFRASASALAYLGAARTVEVNVVHPGGEIERVAGARLTPGTFRWLPYRPVVGRLLVADDGRPGAPPVVVVRESLWNRRLGGDPDVVGRILDVAGTDHEIVGVLPDDAGYPAEGEVWLPLDEATHGAVALRDGTDSRFLGILAEGADPEAARTQLQQISDQISAPGRGAEPLRYQVRALSRLMVSPQVHVGIVAFMSVLVAVLVVIAANVGNLVMARTSRRGAELAVRTALGASRGRIVGQLFAESAVMGALAAGVGLVGAGAILALYDRVLDELPFWVDLHVAPDTALAVAAVAILATGVTSVVPALRATRADPGDALRGAGRGSARIGRLGGLMIAAEVALSVALLGGATLFAEGFRRYVDPAFELPDDRVLTARFGLDPSPTTLPSEAIPPDSLAGLMTTLARTLGQHPEVRAVGFASDLPRTTPWADPIEVEGDPTRATASVVGITPGLLAALEQAPVTGRDFEDTDLGAEALPVALVTEAFARLRFGTTEVVGRRLRRIPESESPDDEAPPWRTVVGVVPDVMEVAGPTEAGGVYVPLAARRTAALALRVDADPLAFAGTLRRAVYDLDPDLRLSDVVRLDDVGAENRAALAALSSGLTGIGVVTLLLSLAGVYAIVSLSVTRRTREIGIRVALGEARGAVLASILRRSGLLLAAGAVVGAAGGLALARVRLFVFAVPEAPWWLFPGLVAATALAGLLACWVPARRALAIQPVEALRHDG